MGRFGRGVRVIGLKPKFNALGDGLVQALVQLLTSSVSSQPG